LSGSGGYLIRVVVGTDHCGHIPANVPFLEFRQMMTTRLQVATALINSIIGMPTKTANPWIEEM